jgi:hypothetical protein
MKISELSSFLSKATSVIGDAEIVVKHAGSEALTDLKGIEVALLAGEADVNGVLTLLHDEPGVSTPAAPASDEARPADGQQAG